MRRGLLPCPVTGKQRAQTASLFGVYRVIRTCFGAAFTSDVTSQLNTRERGGASDSKNPDPYYGQFDNYN